MQPRCFLPPRIALVNQLPARPSRWSWLVPLGLAWLLATGVQAANARRTVEVEVVERVKAAVVNIHSERTVRGPADEELFSMAPSQNRINGMGTGVIIDPRGYIVTNEHVVEDVNVIRIRLSNGGTHTARVLARNQENDLALLKIDVARPLPTMPLGTATDLMVGEKVIAIGNAYGYEHTVTTGIVSALKRDVTLNKEVSYKSLIQTDASINPGNSGGPLLNINGEMVGVNVAIRAGAQGISFAVPVDTMIRVAADMISIRKRKGTLHGLVCRDLVEPLPGTTPSQGEGTVRSLVVERVEPGGPAARAGLQARDVLLQVGDLPIRCSLDLERALLDANANDHVPVKVRRQGGDQQVDLVLQTGEPETPSPAELVWQKLGIRLQPSQGELVSRSTDQLNGGLTVVEVNAEGPAARSGVQRGDVLMGLHQWKTLSLENVAFVLNHKDAASFSPLVFYILRSGQVHRGWFRLQGEE